MDAIIQGKLNELKAKYPDQESQTLVREWEKNLKKSSLFMDLQNHAAFKIITDNFDQELISINKQLSDTPDLFSKPEGREIGLMLHERKRFIKDFLRPFRTAQVEHSYTVSEINKALTETL